MLKTIACLIGLTPMPTPPRPASHRREIPSAPRPTSAPVSDAASDIEAKRAAARAQAQRLSDGRWAEAVRLILRAGDPSDMRYVEPQELVTARARVGQEVSEYLRACRHAGIRVPPIGDADLASAPRLAAYKVDLMQRAAIDAEGWDKGHVALLQRQKDDRKRGLEPEHDLVIPGDVQNAIAKLLADRLARMHRRAGSSGAPVQGAGGAPGTQGTAPPAGPMRPKVDGDEEPEEPGSAPAAPMGMK
ncbi:hypothetical protein [Methylorubrum extorquens]|uniref:hypothetical protein n=1 Tax=Methylorubrum extorquens TaxID=408 RepID=UPI002238C141|nr:hypothetical protein [Methylorubrum extorquens]UYW30353.1 hypothetical protein OKB92_15210 [Methylorubrum extorquens]